MKGKQIRDLVIAVLLPLFVGFAASILSNDAMGFYERINQPAIAPPGIVFPIVWTILYILMGIASYFVYQSDCKHKNTALIVYGIQLAINFFFNIWFFNLQLFFIAFLWTILLLFVNLIMYQLFYRCSKISAYLLIPYIAWNSFAILLSFLVYQLN